MHAVRLISGPGFGRLGARCEHEAGQHKEAPPPDRLAVRIRGDGRSGMARECTRLCVEAAQPFRPGQP